MSLVTIAGLVAKGALMLGKALMNTAKWAGPIIKSVVSAGAVKLGASATVAKVAGKAAGIATSLLIAKGVDSLTNKTIKKVPGVGESADFIVDSMINSQILGGVLR